MALRFIVLLFVFVVVDAYAAKLNKCVREDGHVTFTQTACAGGLAGEVISVEKGGSGMSLGPVDAPVAAEPSSGVTQPNARVTMLGGSSSACDGGTEQEIRTAIVRKQIRTGMTSKQAIQAWGEPGEINRSSSGDNQWVYYRGSYEMQFIYVDQDGCVTGWN